MRIAVVSDTHGNWPMVAEAIKQEGGIDCLMFLGDHAADGRKLQQLLQLPAYIVRGNCDFDDAPEELLVELLGWRLLLCHGHRYQVKNGLQNLYYRGLEQQADIVLFGHTHEACLEEGEVTLINPGSVSERNLRWDRASWGILTLGEKGTEKILKKYEKRTCQNV